VLAPGAYVIGSGSIAVVTDADQGHDPIKSYDSGATEDLYTVLASDFDFQRICASRRRSRSAFNKRAG
jgi:hypothetical protein